MDIINSAEGAVANFITNLAKPLASSKYGIEATQDLNGQTGPYPPGGGKNLLKTSGLSLIPPSNTTYSNATKRTFSFDSYCLGLSHNNYYQPNKITSYSISENSVVMNSSAQAYGIGMPMTLEVGVRYNLSFVTTGGRIATSFYSLDGTALSFIDNATNNYYFTVPEDTAYVVFVFKATANGVEATFSNIQVEKGSSATTWAPYSNICPITGRTTAKIFRNSGNLVDDSIKYIYSGNIVYIGANNSGYNIFLKAGTYRASVDFSGERYGFYSRSSEDASNIMIWGSNSGAHESTFVLPKDGYYRFWVYYSPSFGTIDVNKIKWVKVEPGSVTTPYETYNGESKTISIVDGIYSLYPDYAPYFQGLLAGTHNYLDLGSMTWTRTSISGGGYGFYANPIGSDIKIPPNTSTMPSIICSKYKTKLPLQYSQKITGITIYTNGTIQVYDSDIENLTAQKFKSAMSGFYLIYELNTPITPTITNEQFDMLLHVFGATCYGGNLIIDKYGHRKLNITHKIMSIPHDVVLESGTWNPSTGNGKFYYIAGIGNVPSDWDNSENNNGVICDTLQLDNVGTRSTKSGIMWYNNWIIRWIDIPRMSMTLADYKNYLSAHPIKCTYKLKTPLVINLPDGETFTSFIGYNNIFCDTGDTTVQYYISVVMDSMESNLVPGEDIKSINVSQNDAGRKVRVSLFDNSVVYNVPSGYVVTGKILTPNHEIVDVEIDDIGDSYVDITIPEEAVSSCGTAMCKLRVKDSEEHPLYDVGFSTFFIKVEPAP